MCASDLYIITEVKREGKLYLHVHLATYLCVKDGHFLTKITFNDFYVILLISGDGRKAKKTSFVKIIVLLEKIKYNKGKFALWKKNTYTDNNDTCSFEKRRTQPS